MGGASPPPARIFYFSIAHGEGKPAICSIVFKNHKTHGHKTHTQYTHKSHTNHIQIPQITQITHKSHASHAQITHIPNTQITHKSHENPSSRTDKNRILKDCINPKISSFNTPELKHFENTQRTIRTRLRGRVEKNDNIKY